MNGTGTGTLRRLGLALVCALGLAGCGGATPRPLVGSCSLPADALPTGAEADAHLAALLRAETSLVVSQQIDALMALWASDGQVVDAKQTPDDPTDDQRWIGQDAIRHRYVRTVFPGNPQPPPADAPPPDLAITYDGDRATVRATTRIGSEIAPAGDQWTFTRSGPCWLIESLTYNLESREQGAGIRD